MKSRVERDATTARITERDLTLLSFIARAGPVATEHVRAFSAMSTAMTRRRLRALFDLGNVTTFVTNQEAPNRYAITGKGKEVLVERGGQAAEVIRVPKGKAQPNPHHDGSVRFYVALHHACLALRTVRLDKFLFEADIRRALPDARGALIPDAVALLTREGDGAQLGVALEVDRGTEKNPSWVAERKGVPYAELARTGVPLAGCNTWRVLCTVPTERRRNRLAAALYEAGVPEELWFLALDADVRADQVLRPIWRTVRASADGASARLVAESPFSGVITDHDVRGHGLPAISHNGDAELSSGESHCFTGGGVT